MTDVRLTRREVLGSVAGGTVTTLAGCPLGSGDGSDGFVPLALAADACEVEGGYIVGGNLRNDFWTAKVRRDGALEWSRTHSIERLVRVQRFVPGPEGYLLVGTRDTQEDSGSNTGSSVTERRSVVVGVDERGRRRFQWVPPEKQVVVGDVSSTGDGYRLVGTLYRDGKPLAWDGKLRPDGSLAWQRNFESHSTFNGVTALEDGALITGSVYRNRESEGLEHWGTYLGETDEEGNSRWERGDVFSDIERISRGSPNISGSGRVAVPLDDQRIALGYTTGAGVMDLQPSTPEVAILTTSPEATAASPHEAIVTTYGSFEDSGYVFDAATTGDRFVVVGRTAPETDPRVSMTPTTSAGWAVAYPTSPTQSDATKPTPTESGHDRDVHESLWPSWRWHLARDSKSVIQGITSLSSSGFLLSGSRRHSDSARAEALLVELGTDGTERWRQTYYPIPDEED